MGSGAIRVRIITRRIPGYTWVQFCLTDTWRWGTWWSYTNVVQCHAYGPIRVFTLRPRPAVRATPGDEE